VKNAHERMGWLEFTRALKDTTVRVRLRVDRCIAEMAGRGSDGKLHLVSVIGGDSDVGAGWAAVVQNHVFKIEAPGLSAAAMSLGEKAECFRGGLNVPGCRRGVRHLVAVSAEMAQTRLGGGIETDRTILAANDSIFMFYRLSERFGLPVVRDWAAWFVRELRRHRAITPLAGLGCSPVLVKGTKDKFLRLLSRGLEQGIIQFPHANGPVRWPVMAEFLARLPGEQSSSGPALS
jgi:hypothetical protein